MVPGKGDAGLKVDQRPTVIIDWREQGSQALRWSITSFEQAGFPVMLRKDGRLYRTTGHRPYLGDEVSGDPGSALLVSAGHLPANRSFDGGIPEGHAPVPAIRGRLQPGCTFKQTLPPPGQDGLFVVDGTTGRPWGLVPGRRRFDPKPVVWEVGRSVVSAMRKGAYLAAAGSALRGLRDVMQSWREDCAALPPPAGEGQFTVTYVLERLVIAGGVLSVIQLVNELVLAGIDARIACLFEDPAVYRWQPMLTRPMVFRNPRDLVRSLPPTDIAVATLWKTAPWVAQLKSGGKAGRTVYFLQGYEPWFFPERMERRRQQIVSEYGLMDHHVVKTDWLARKMSGHNINTRKIPLGLNLDVFYPRQKTDRRPRLVAMARPDMPNFGFDLLISVLGLLRQRIPELGISLFGSRHLPDPGFAFDNHGIVEDHARLARIYGEADVFVDAARFQGFGRCGLEAMACGTACVLRTSGGVSEYAVGDVNALVYDTDNPEVVAGLVESLLDNPDQRQALATRGLETAQQHCHQLEAETTAGFFRSILGIQEEPA
ncbi:MAG: glycosyltransferase family 4 protein [Xanthomonadales bacterium]|nr:glycosyltransferase family 4 protein [Xanthomonadales bacterium]